MHLYLQRVAETRDSQEKQRSSETDSRSTAKHQRLNMSQVHEAPMSAAPLARTCISSGRSLTLLFLAWKRS